MAAEVDSAEVDRLVMEYFRKMSEGHKRLKERIHAFRLPLSPMGVRMMKVVYFTIPIVTGYYIMQVAIGYSERNTAPLLKEKAEERRKAQIQVPSRKKE